MKAMKTLDEKTPPKFKEAHRKCMESKKKEDFKDIEVQCEKEKINVPAQFVFAVRDPKEFVSCALTALKEVNV
ncbi:hypothetical protein TNCT_706911 [Trichonephila clavata]|uniref:Uncharacterized protein n=1 Tax=Trichonephila clavata TaxID=2740835 RepID=A0A8X6KWK1_TRICU|nr:hypothetical protein TNCT_706911 [Trichonephila clavata]